MKRRTAKHIVFGLLALYPLSYLVVSWGGFYEPAAYGLLQGRDGKPILAPKYCFGYDWIPFEGYHQSGGIDGVSLQGWAYYPLLLIDRALWHRSDRWKDRPDITRNYFDYDALEYREGRKGPSEQAGAGQPTNDPESKPEGSGKAQPDPEGRAR